ncbi:MAG: carboxypeptidase-like regulatory domain-containing protein [Acidobacteriota bacterium]|nr:carboxypeptidase-like regulatory domain-containing protein [Acidobacteriota bacterium]
MFIRTLTLLALTLLCSALTFAQTQPKAGTATITGRVTLKGEPAAGASVGLQPQQTSAGGAPGFPDRSKYSRTKTDAEGRFSFSSLNAGQYRIVALAPGFVSADDSQLTGGKLVNLADGENLENVELRLKPGAVITGRVTDPIGNPVVEKTVQLSKMDARGNFVRFGVGYQSLTTDDRGVYRVHSLPAGKYKISLGYSQQDGFRPEVSRQYYVKTFHPNVIDEKEAKIIELRDGSETTDIDIKIAEAKKTYDVFGKVIEAATGQPVVGVRIGQMPVQPTGNVSGGVMMSMASMPTDTNGDFHLQGLTSGKYLLLADSRYDSVAADFYSDTTPVEINESDVVGVEIRAHRGASISGVAVVEGTNDPAILKQLTSLNLNLIYRASTESSSNRNARPAANGTFRLRGLKPGKADIRAFTPAEGLKQIRIEHNGAPVTDGFDIQAGENLANVRVVFGYGTAAIRGQLKIIGGVLPEGVQVTAIIVKFLGGSASNFNVAVDSRGQFLVKNLTAGEYEVKPFAYSMNRTPEITALLDQINKTAQRVTVGGGETPTELIVDLSRKENDR